MNGVILFVTAFRECIRFYREKIGLETLMEKPGIVRFRFGSMYIQIEDAVEFKAIPTANVILREGVPSIAEMEKVLAAKGVRLEVHHLDWGDIGFVHDPSGNKVEFFREARQTG